jgi:hypothetical protein
VNCIDEHPAWCDRRICGIGDRGSGAHLSRMMLDDPDPGVGLWIGVQLSQSNPTQGFPRSGRVLVAVTIRLSHVPFSQIPHHGDDTAVVLTGARTQVLGRLLVSAGRAACASETAAP